MRVGLDDEMRNLNDDANEINNALDCEEVKGPIQIWL